MRKIILLCLLVVPVRSIAQNEMIDTLRASVITTSRLNILGAGSISTNLEGMVSVASPLGEGDPIRWIQYLPGVAAGTDGTSAAYVRGGNLGGNLLTLDGIPVYGYSHVLGLTTVIPNEEIESVSFVKGGFGGGQGNFTSSHIAVTTRQPSLDRIRGTVTADNFLVGGSVSGPVSDQLSFSVSGRVSPLALEYQTLKSMMKAGFGSLDRFKAGVGDLFGKLQWKIGPGRDLSASVLGSLDHYAFNTSDASEITMGWDNLAALARYRYDGAKGHTGISLSYVVYRNAQALSNNYKGTENHFSLLSGREELTLSGDYAAKSKGPVKLSAGGQLRYALFNPVKMSGHFDRKRTGLALAYLRTSLDLESLDLDATVRPTVFRSDTTCFSVDVNLKGRWQFLPSLAIELTFDRIAQYFHTLEGLPIGWSMDLQVPSSTQVPAETMTQGYAGLVAAFGGHTVSVGAYAKKLDDVIYFKEARNFFNPAISSWEGEIDLGKGDSKGLECMYVYQGKDLFVQASATLSKSMRWGFSDVNEGKPFHAPFDRRKVGNVSVQWRGAGVSFTYQDGNWVNGAGERYTMLDPIGKEVELDYFRSVNDYRMPAVIRLDLSYRFEWSRNRVEHSLNVGVYNVLNHFNSFTVYYDTKEQTWKELALIPILPNLCYRVRF